MGVRGCFFGDCEHAGGLRKGLGQYLLCGQVDIGVVGVVVMPELIHEGVVDHFGGVAAQEVVVVPGFVALSVGGAVDQQQKMAFVGEQAVVDFSGIGVIECFFGGKVYVGLDTGGGVECL